MTTLGAFGAVIPSVWGHFAGGGLNPDDMKFIDDALKEPLAS